MAPFHLHQQFFETTRGRIVNALRRGPATVDEIAAGLHVTENAVRVQLTSMERDGLIRRGPMRRGATRPSSVFELTPEVEQLLSSAYVPLLQQLLQLLSKRTPPREFDAMLRQAGRDLASGLSVATPRDTFATRVRAASDLLNEEFGSLTDVEKPNGHFVIRGHGCPLSALTDKHPSVCRGVESFLAEVLKTKVKECCDRSGRPRCCFEVYPPARGAPRSRRAG